MIRFFYARHTASPPASSSCRGWDLTAPSALFISSYQLALLLGLPAYLAYTQPEPGMVAAALALLMLGTIGVGSVYHRAYSHRACSLRVPAEIALLFLASLTFQGSGIRWVHDHRRHHALAETDADPYDVRRGFWYAHMLWLFEQEEPIDPRWVRDLLDNRIARFQHEHYGALAVVSNVAVWLFVGWLCSDYLGAFVLAWWTRLFFGHHLIWLLNSVGHIWGRRHYAPEITATDSHWLALLSGGEGYHNYHHAFPGDYRNGPRWYQLDATKWTLFFLSKIGQAYDLKRVDDRELRRRARSGEWKGPERSAINGVDV